MSDRLGRVVGDAVALLCGLLLPLGFAPYGHFPVPLLVLPLALQSWVGRGARIAAWRGWLFGLGSFGHGVGWVHLSISDYTDSGLPVALAITALLVLYLALFPALLAVVLAVTWERSRAVWRIALLLPAGWVALEWLRGWLLTGFPWLELGYSQVDSPLRFVAPLAGHLGVSAAAALSAGLLWGAVHATAFGRTVAVLLLAGGWGALLLYGDRDWSVPSGEPFRATLVQGNVPQQDKWRPEQRGAMVDRHLELTEPHWGNPLIVWPETAVPAFFDQVADDLLPELRRRATASGSALLLGIAYRDRDTDRYYNAMLGLGERPGLYLKRHLVPFGEYLPLRPLLGWVVKFLQFPMADFSRGTPDQPPLLLAGRRVGVTICFEDIFAAEVRAALPAAELLVNASNDAWFGSSIGPHQHLEMARMRALESGRYLLRATSTGISAIIDHRGRVVARSPQFTAHALTAEVEPRQGATPYVRFGDWPLLGVALLGLLAGWDWRRRQLGW